MRRSTHRTTSRRSGSRRTALIGAAVAAAVLVTGVPATAFALTAAQPAARPAAVHHARSAAHHAPAAGAASPAAVTARVVAPGATALHGWAGTTRHLLAGTTFRDGVRVSGGKRTVRLERAQHGRWRVVARVVTRADGRATLTWRVPAQPGRVRVRVHVLHTAVARPLLTPGRILVVRAPAEPVPSASPSAAPSVSPSAAPSAVPSAAPSAPPSSAPPAVPSGNEAIRARLLVLVNQARATARTCGAQSYPAVPPLVRSDPLDKAAGDYATLMATKDFFSHDGPDGSDPGTRLAAVGVKGVSWAENIAAGQADADAAMAAWLTSPGHCSNIMSPSVHRVGFGYALTSTSKYRKYWVQDFAG